MRRRLRNRPRLRGRGTTKWWRGRWDCTGLHPGRSNSVRLAAVVAALAATQPAAAAEGREVFQRCYACHSMDPRETGLQGPNLAGVVGRRAGSLPGFEYSPAMREAGARGLVWTEAALDRFLADAEAVVPKSEMFTPPLRAPAERAAVIAYLKNPKGSR